jgi:hypothetical protein
MSKDTSQTKTQIDRFREKARALGCDEDEASFKEKLKTIARQRPKESSSRMPSKEASKKG